MQISQLRFNPTFESQKLYVVSTLSKLGHGDQN